MKTMIIDAKMANHLLGVAAGFATPAQSLTIACHLTRIYLQQGEKLMTVNARFIGWDDTWIFALIYILTASADQTAQNAELTIELT